MAAFALVPVSTSATNSAFEMVSAVTADGSERARVRFAATLNQEPTAALFSWASNVPSISSNSYSLSGTVKLGAKPMCSFLMSVDPQTDLTQPYTFTTQAGRVEWELPFDFVAEPA